MPPIFHLWGHKNMKAVCQLSMKLYAIKFFFKKSGRGLQGQGHLHLNLVSTARACHKEQMWKI